MEQVEVSAGTGAMIVKVAAARGASADKLCKATGFDRSRASDPDARIPLEMEEALWAEAARLTGDECFGLHAAQAVQPGMFDVLDYAVRSAPNLRAACQRLIRYNRLVHDAAIFRLQERGATARIEHAFRTPGFTQGRHPAEFTMAAVVVISSQVTGAPLKLRAVELKHGRPSDAAVAELTRFFGVEPRFAAREDAIEFDRASLELALPAADPGLSRVIERHAEALLAARPEPTLSTADRVRRVLADALGDGEATLAAAARRLHMSERTVQRRLSAEGLTFDALLEGLRRDLALRYLADRKIAIAEVAYLLGYSEPSPFHRAFKRWTGRTPAEARQAAA